MHIFHVLVSLRRRYKVLGAIAFILIVGGVAFYWSANNTTLLVFPQVWSQYSPYGSGYEFKVNDAQIGPNQPLESGWLSTVDRVVVTDTKGIEYELERDYEINNYSGEVTRRFVLYGPEDSHLPETGRYRFDFIKDGEISLTKYVDYVQSNIGYPTDISWERRGEDIYVEWTPPANVGKKNWYKVLIWSHEDTPESFISLRFEGEAASGLLEDVPFVEDGKYQLNVAVYYNDGYSYSHYHYFIWDEDTTSLGYER